MKTLRLPLVGVLAALLCAASLPASAQDGGNLFENLFKPQGNTQDVQRERAEQSEMIARIERIENALRQLTGQVEQLQYRNQQLESEVRRLGGNVEPSAAAGTRAPAQPVGPMGITPRVPAAPAVGNGKRSDAFDPKADPMAPGAPRPLGSPASAAANLAPPGGGAPAVPGAAATPRELYEVGQSQLQRQDYAGAEQTFRQIIQGHNGDRMVPDATFMLGETLFLRQNYNDAAASFLEVSTKYPNSTRAPEALLRLGQSLAALGEKETACATFLEVDRKYPRIPSALRQAVEREQKRVGC